MENTYTMDMVNACTTLTERERKVLTERLGNHKTLEEIGKMYNVTRTRIHDIEVNALAKLNK